jgi:hypothetical protein
MSDVVDEAAIDRLIRIKPFFGTVYLYLGQDLCLFFITKNEKTFSTCKINSYFFKIHQKCLFHYEGFPIHRKYLYLALLR